MFRVEEWMKKKGIIRVAAAILAVALITGFVAWLRDGSEQGDSAGSNSIQVITPESGTVSVSIEAPAVIESLRKLTVRSAVSGLVAQIATDGDIVTEGQVVARLDPGEAEARLARAELELQEAHLVLERAKRVLEKSRVELADTEALHEVGAVSGEQLLERRDALAEAEHARGMAELSLEKKRLDLVAAEYERDSTAIRAPYDGVVIDTFVDEGDAIGSNTALVTVADLSSVRLLSEIDEYDVTRVQVGMPVRATVEAVRTRSGFPASFSSAVDSISPAADIVNNISVFRVAVTIHNPEGRLRPGMTADVSIGVEEDTGLVVPVRAVVTEQGRSFVNVLLSGEGAGDARESGSESPAVSELPSGSGSPAGSESGAAPAAPETEKRRVVLGAADGVNVVVLEGLEQGERIVMSSTAGVSVPGAPSASSNGSAGVIPIPTPGAGTGGGGGGGGRQ
jgi:HlyD family secretion protein